MGGKIHCDLTINLTHIGQYGYKGSIIHKLKTDSHIFNINRENNKVKEYDSSTESSEIISEKTEVIDELLNEIKDI